MKKLFAVLLAALTLAAGTLLTSCEVNDPEEGIVSLKTSTQITLNGDTAACDSDSVYITEDKITIAHAGTYVLSGTLNDGQIYVDCVDAGIVDIVLNNANITNNDGAAIFIKKAQEAVLTMYEGSTNVVADGANYVFDNPEDDEPNAAIFSKEDLIVTGTGSLQITGNYSGGLYSKDGLEIKDGTITVDSVNHGIKGKDYLVMRGGSVTVNAVGDGVKSTNYDNDLVGYIEINGGTLTVNAEDEAIQAVSAIRFNGGSVTVNTTNNGIKCVGALAFNGGTVAINAEDNAMEAASVDLADACTVTVNGSEYKG